MKKLISWNVNGLRACVGKGCFYEFMSAQNPDVICLQETKLQQGQITMDLLEYHEYWNCAEKKGYSARKTSRDPLQRVSRPDSPTMAREQ